MTQENVVNVVIYDMSPDVTHLLSKVGEFINAGQTEQAIEVLSKLSEAGKIGYAEQPLMKDAQPFVYQQ